MQVVQSDFQVPVACGRRSKSTAPSRVNRYGLYLVSRRTATYFRCVVPVPLRNLLGKREIIRSLGTVSQRVARPIALIMGSRLRVLFVKMIESIDSGVVVERSELSQAVHDVLDQELEALSLSTTRRLYLDGEADCRIVSDLTRAAHKYGKNPSSIENRIEAFRYIAASLRCVDAGAESGSDSVAELLRDVTCDELRELISYIQREKKEPIFPWDEPEEDSCSISDEKRAAVMAVVQGVITAKRIAHEHGELDMSFSEEMRRNAHAEVDKVYGARDLGAPSTVANDGLTRDDAVAIAQCLGLPMIKPVTLGEAIEAYRQSILDNPMQYPNGFDPTKRLTLEEFALSFGEKTMTSDVSVVQVEKYINLLHHLPNRANKVVLRDDIWSYITDPHLGRIIEAGTVKTRLMNIRAFFNDMERRKFISHDALRSISHLLSSRINAIEEAKRLDKNDRPYEPEELRKLFCPSDYLSWSSLHAEDYWLPLLGLFTGARSEELVKLKRKDVKQTPEQPFRAGRKDTSRAGIWFLDLTSGERRLKVHTSYRVVPLHSFLIELGFADYLSDFDQEDFIFPFYANKAKGKFGDEYRRYRRSVGVGREENETEGERLHFHTFRKNAINAFKDYDVTDSVNREIVGHGIAGGKKDAHTQNYEQRHTIEKLYDDGIKVLDCYLEQIPELFALKDSPWTKPASQRGVIPKRRPRRKKAEKKG